MLISLVWGYSLGARFLSFPGNVNVQQSLTIPVLEDLAYHFKSQGILFLTYLSHKALKLTNPVKIITT